MQRLIIFLTGIVILVCLVGCSPSEETTKTDEKPEEDEIYVFDEVPIDDVPADEVESPEIKRTYIIQIGAFSSKENADKFAEESTMLLSEEIEVDFNERISMYVVTLSRVFNSREAALYERNKLWQFNQFRDAWLREVK